MQEPRRIRIGNELFLAYDEEALRLKYVTAVTVGHTANEFVMQLLQTPPNNEGIGVLLGSFVFSPAHAKSLAMLFGGLVQSYEAMYGAIPELKRPANAPPAPPVITGQGAN
jgi:hypothetical protein